MKNLWEQLLFIISSPAPKCAGEAKAADQQQLWSSLFICILNMSGHIATAGSNSTVLHMDLEETGAEA